MIIFCELKDFFYCYILYYHVKKNLITDFINLSLQLSKTNKIIFEMKRSLR